MIIYLFKIVLLLHLTIVQSERVQSKLAPKNPQHGLDRNKLGYSDYDINSQVIKLIPPSQADCYCGKKYPNSISDQLNPTDKAEIERFVVYLYVKRENNQRESYIYLPNAEKQKLMPDFAKSDGDVLVKNSDTNDEDKEDSAQFNGRAHDDSSNNDDNIDADVERREYSTNLLHSIGSGLVLDSQETTPFLYPNQDKTRLLDSWHFVDPNLQKVYKSKFPRSINKRDLLQSILDDNDAGESRNGIRSKLSWLKLTTNSYSYQEKEVDILKSGEQTIEDYKDDNDVPNEYDKYVRPNLNKQRGFNVLNPIKPLSDENSWENSIEGQTRRPSTNKQLKPHVLSYPGHSSTKQWSWHKQTQRPLHRNRGLKALKPIQPSLYEKPWSQSVESKSDKVKTYWKRPIVTKQFQSKPPKKGTLQPLKPISRSQKKHGLNLRPEKKQLGPKTLKPKQSPKNLNLNTNLLLQAPKPPIGTDLDYEKNRNWPRPKDINKLRPQSFYANDEIPTLASFDEEDQNKNVKPWTLSLEEELIEPKNYGLDNSNMYKAIYRQKHSDWSTQKPLNRPNKEHLGSHEYLQKPKSNKDRWSFRVTSKSSAKPKAQNQYGSKISPTNPLLYKNVLKKSKPKTRSIQSLSPKKSISYGPGTNSTTTDLPIDGEAPKFRIIGGRTAVGSGDPLKTKGRRAVG